MEDKLNKIFKKIFTVDSTVEQCVFIDKKKLRELIASLKIQGVAVQNARSEDELSGFINDQKKSHKGIECVLDDEVLEQEVDKKRTNGDTILMRCVGTPSNTVPLFIKKQQLMEFKGFFCLPIKYFTPALRMKIDDIKKSLAKTLMTKENIQVFFDSTGGFFTDDFKQKMWRNRDAAYEELWKRDNDKFIKSLNDNVKMDILGKFGEKTYRLVNDDAKTQEIALNDFLPDDKIVIKNYYITDYYAMYDDSSWLKKIPFVNKLRRPELKFLVIS